MPRLKDNYQKQRTGKENMKLIIRLSKVNNFSVHNESGDHIRMSNMYLIKKLFLFYQELKS